MALHLIKLCVGADSVEDLERWTSARAAERLKAGEDAVNEHVTRMYPRRDGEIAGKGSLFWVIKGAVLVRQPILGFSRRTGADRIERCIIALQPTLIRTEAQPRRAFQGWRYLAEEDAPQDLASKGRGGLPPALGRELAELGLL